MGLTQNAQGGRHYPVSFTQCSMDHRRNFQNGLASLRRSRSRVNVIGLRILPHDQAERSRTQYHREDKRILGTSSRAQIAIYNSLLCMYDIYICLLILVRAATICHIKDSTNAKKS